MSDEATKEIVKTTKDDEKRTFRLHDHLRRAGPRLVWPL